MLWNLFHGALMANIDKTSVRNEVSRVRADFERLCSKGEISGETRMLMSSMLMIVELMLSIFLERVTKKNARNSSIPPSQTDPDHSALHPARTHGKGKTQNPMQAQNARVKEQVTRVTVAQCDVCGEDLGDTPCLHQERRTK